MQILSKFTQLRRTSRETTRHYPCLGQCVEQRINKLNRHTRTSGDALSALLCDGLILWRLSTPERRDLWCFIFERPEGFFLVVDDDPNGTDPYQVHEQHPDIVSVGRRSEALRAFLVKCGWEDVDVE